MSMAGHRDRHRVKKKRRRTSSASDVPDSEVVVKEEKVEDPVMRVSMDKTMDDYVSDVDDDGHFPHLLHLTFPSLDSRNPRASYLRLKGLKVRSGPLSDREKERISANMTEIMNSPPVCNFWSTEEEYDDVFFSISGMFATIKNGIKSGLTKRHILGTPVRKDPLACPYRNFYFRLGRGLPYRTIRSISDFCRDHLTSLRHRNSLTDDDINRIVEGRRQQVAPQQLAYDNRASPNAVHNVIHNNLTPTLEYRIRRPFTFSEDAKFIKAIKKQLSLERIEDYDKSMKINFSEVAMQLRGRTSLDCRHRFESIFLRITDFELNLLQRRKRDMCMDMSKILFYIFKEEETDCELAIDWAAIRVKLPHLPMTTAMDLFRDLMSKVPEHEMLDFREKIEWLMENQMPKLTKRMRMEDPIKHLEDFYESRINFYAK